MKLCSTAASAAAVALVLAAGSVITNEAAAAQDDKGGSLFARILPMFETGAAKYAWLNNVVAAGVYRPRAGKIGYRVYQIL
jgi:hypothetical protein